MEWTVNSGGIASGGLARRNKYLLQPWTERSEERWMGFRTEVGPEVKCFVGVSWSGGKGNRVALSKGRR